MEGRSRRASRIRLVVGLLLRCALPFNLPRKRKICHSRKLQRIKCHPRIKYHSIGYHQYTLLFWVVLRPKYPTVEREEGKEERRWPCSSPAGSTRAGVGGEKGRRTAPAPSGEGVDVGKEDGAGTSLTRGGGRGDEEQASGGGGTHARLPPGEDEEAM